MIYENAVKRVSPFKIKGPRHKLLAALKPENIYFFTEYERNEIRAVDFFKNCGINCEFLDI